MQEIISKSNSGGKAKSVLTGWVAWLCVTVVFWSGICVTSQQSNENPCATLLHSFTINFPFCTFYWGFNNLGWLLDSDLGADQTFVSKQQTLIDQIVVQKKINCRILLLFIIACNSKLRVFLYFKLLFAQKMQSWRRHWEFLQLWPVTDKLDQLDSVEHIPPPRPFDNVFLNLNQNLVGSSLSYFRSCPQVLLSFR